MCRRFTSVSPLARLSVCFFKKPFLEQKIQNKKTFHLSSVPLIQAPQLLGPFLATSDLNGFVVANGTDSIPSNSVSRISVPFAVAGALYLFCAVAMALCWLINPYVAPVRSVNGKDVQRAKKAIESSGTKDELLIPNRTFYAIFVFLAIAFSALEGLAEYQYLYLTPIFLGDYLRISNDQKTNALFLLGLAYIVGRGLNVLISALKVSVTTIICMNILLLFAGGGLIAFLSPASEHLSMLTSAAVILLSLGYSSLLPGKLMKRTVFLRRQSTLLTQQSSSSVFQTEFRR